MSTRQSFPCPPIFRHATLYQKMFLRAVVAIFRSTGIEETTFRDVYLQLKDLLEMEGMLEGKGKFVQ